MRCLIDSLINTFYMYSCCPQVKIDLLKVNLNVLHYK